MTAPEETLLLPTGEVIRLRNGAEVSRRQTMPVAAVVAQFGGGGLDKADAPAKVAPVGGKPAPASGEQASDTPADSNFFDFMDGKPGQATPATSEARPVAASGNSMAESTASVSASAPSPLQSLQGNTQTNYAGVAPSPSANLPAKTGELLRDESHAATIAKNTAYCEAFAKEATFQMQQCGEVTSDAVVIQVGMPPGSPNAVGAAMRAVASANGWRVAEYRKSTRPSCHAAVVAVWVAAE